MCLRGLRLDMPPTNPNRRTTQIVCEADETLLELKRAVEKFQRQQDGIVKAEGPSASASSVAITKRWLPELAEGVRKAVADTRQTRQVHAEFLAVICGLEPELLALCILQGTLHSIGREQTILKRRFASPEQSKASVGPRVLSNVIRNSRSALKSECEGNTLPQNAASKLLVLSPLAMATRQPIGTMNYAFMPAIGR